MAIVEQRERYFSTTVSSIGNVILDMVKAPLNFTKDIVSIPSDFVGDTISGTTTKVVLIVGLLIVGLVVIGKYNILKQVGNLK